jgi:hypothetical protein
VLTAAAAATCSWEAVLLVLDSRPFEDLHHIVEDFQDDRIWVFAEWVRAGMRLQPAPTCNSTCGAAAAAATSV